MRRSPARHPLTPPQYPHPYFYPAPEKQGPGAISIIGTIIMSLCALAVAGGFLWRIFGGTLPSMPGAQPTRAPFTTGGGVGNTGGNTGAQTGAQDDIAAYNATQQAIAPVQAPAVAQPIIAPAGVNEVGNPIPTAIILIPTAVPVEQVVVVPQSFPTLAEGSDMRPTAVPTMPYPTALPAAIADNFTVSPDGTCITAPRNGKLYQVCQGWKYAPAEMASVADYIRTGLLPGVEVQ